MHIDYINDGSHDCPFIRLFSDQKESIVLLRGKLLKLGRNEIAEVIISNLPFSKSRSALIFKTDTTDTGIIISRDRKELCVAVSAEKWLLMAEMLYPFEEQQTGYVWLFESPKNSLLFTTTGYW